MGAAHEVNWDSLDALVGEVMEKEGIPGIAVGILHKGEIGTAGYGVTNVDHPLPVTDETLFQIGSITKTFTDVLMMRLMEMGKLELDATVRTYLPDFRVADEDTSSRVTIRHLLTHMSGWAGDLFRDTGSGDDAMARYMAEMAELEQLAPLGTVWSYNNAGFYLAGYIIEVVTGKSYEAALKELVLDPLGMETCYLDPADAMTYRFAVGHKVTEQGPQVARPWALPRAVYACGGLVCHVKDLLRYARFHLGDGSTEDGTRLLTQESMSLLHSPQVTMWGEHETMGLDWFIKDVGGVRQLSHGGGTNGQITVLLLVPQHDFAIAIFTNADRGMRVRQEVTRWALKQYLGLETPDPVPLESSEEELLPYVGRYVRPYSEIELGMLGGKLVAQVTPKGSFPSQHEPIPPAPPPMSLALCEKDRLLVLDGPMRDSLVDIIRKPDGSIGWLRSGRIHVRET